jgi:hypothetical protein
MPRKPDLTLNAFKTAEQRDLESENRLSDGAFTLEARHCGAARLAFPSRGFPLFLARAMKPSRPSMIVDLGEDWRRFDQRIEWFLAGTRLRRPRLASAMGLISCSHSSSVTSFGQRK